MYINGVSSSLPEDVQVAFLRTIRGFKNIEVVRPGYAVEYDYLNPIQLKSSLETKLISGLFLAGQTNGTSGYEEAAAQGLIAGINACQYIRGEEPLVLGRDEAYIGVLIDDLVKEGATEPYRMFTSRAEYRLRLRQDNADMRLSPYALKYGLLEKDEQKTFNSKLENIKKLKEEFVVTKLTNEEIDNIGTDEIKKGATWLNYLKNPNTEFIDAYHLYQKSHNDVKQDDFITASIEIKYKGYIDRLEKEIERSKKLEDKSIPTDIDYDEIFGLSSEAREKLKNVQPNTLGLASRISGVTPSDISILSMHIYKHTRTGCYDK